MLLSLGEERRWRAVASDLRVRLGCEKRDGGSRGERKRRLSAREPLCVHASLARDSSSVPRPALAREARAWEARRNDVGSSWTQASSFETHPLLLTSSSPVRKLQQTDSSYRPSAPQLPLAVYGCHLALPGS